MTGGIYSDEYEGQIAISRLARTLDPGKVQGRVIMMPVCNIPAALNNTRSDLIVQVAPHQTPHVRSVAAKNFNVDAPGSTSANLASLGHTLCARPIYPFEPDTVFNPPPRFIRRGRHRLPAHEPTIRRGACPHTNEVE
jgi:predicted deacylase